MASLIRLKQDIQFNVRLGGLLEAMKLIAAQQFQMLERALRSNPTFFEVIETIAGTFDLQRMAHPFTQGGGPMGVIAVTSDTGLLGGLNQQVVVTAVQEYRREPGELMMIGERGAGYVRELGLSCRSFPGVQENNRGTLASQVRDYALNRVLSGHLAALTIVFPRALSFSLQRVELLRALPCTEWFRDRTVPRPVRSGPVLLESSFAETMEYLVWLWLGSRLVDVFGMSRLAELAARSVHLEGSSQELQRRRQKLWLRYFRERREVIDRNLRELFAARSLFNASSQDEEPAEEDGDAWSL
jgi:F0F1-type ATP synthase gamma subunit